MTIRDRDRYNQSSPDWALLNGCFGECQRSACPRRRPHDSHDDVMDVDGNKNWHGVDLFLEHKLPGGNVNDGEDISFSSKRDQGNVVIVFWSASPDGSDTTHMQVYESPPGGPWSTKRPATLEDVRAKAREWFAQADARPRKRRHT